MHAYTVYTSTNHRRKGGAPNITLYPTSPSLSAAAISRELNGHKFCNTEFYAAYLSDELDLNSFSAQLFMYNFNCSATFGCVCTNKRCKLSRTHLKHSQNNNDNDGSTVATSEAERLQFNRSSLCTN